MLPTKSLRKQSILNYISTMLDKTLYRAIQIILEPCCYIELTSNVATCSTDGTAYYLKTVNSIGFFGKGELIVLVDGVQVDAEIIEPNTISIVETEITSGDHDVEITFLLPTNSNERKGVYISTEIQEITFPSC